MMKNVMGAPDPEEEQYEMPDGMAEYENRANNINNKLTVNFADKIMGGANGSNFLSGKFKSLDGMENYSQKIKMLTGFKMNNETNNTQKINIPDSMQSENKIATMLQQNKSNIDVANMLGGKNKKSNINVSAMFGGKSKHSGNKITDMLGGGNKNSGNKITNMLGGGNKKTSDSISMMLGGKTKKAGMNVNSMLSSKGKNVNVTDFFGSTNKNKKIESVLGVGNRAFGGLNAADKIKNLFRQPKQFNLLLNKPKNLNIKTQKQNAINKINGFLGNVKKPKSTTSNIFGNPERYAQKRLKQGKGLPMFGDFDKDKVLNIFDCSPRNPMLQGNRHLTDAEKASEQEIYDVMTDDLPGHQELYPKAKPKKQDPIYDALAGDIGDDFVPLTAPPFPDAKEPGVSESLTSNPLGLPAYTESAAEAEESQFAGQSVSATQGLTFGPEQIAKAGNNIGAPQDYNTKLLKELQTKIDDKTTDPKIRSAYISQFKTVLSHQPTPADSRAENRLQFDKDKYTESKTERLGKEAFAINKLNADNERKNAMANKIFNFDKLKAKKSWEKDESAITHNRALQERQFAAADKAYEANQALKDRQQALLEIKADRRHKMDMTKLRVAEQQGNIVRDQHKLNAGKSLMEGLMGGSSKPVDWNAKISNANPMNFNPSKFMGTPESANNPYAPSGEMKVMNSVGANVIPRSFSDKVKESVSNTQPTTLIQERRVVQQMEQPPQAVQQPQYAPTPRYMAPPVQQQGYSQQQQRYPQQTGVYVNPQSPAYDSEYAAYRARTKDKVAYPRGPYKKRR